MTTIISYIFFSRQSNSFMLAATVSEIKKIDQSSRLERPKFDSKYSRFLRDGAIDVLNINRRVDLRSSPVSTTTLLLCWRRRRRMRDLPSGCALLATTNYDFRLGTCRNIPITLRQIRLGPLSGSSEKKLEVITTMSPDVEQY